MQRFKKVNILLVDDNNNSLVALEAALQELGQQIFKAPSGEAALAYVLKYDFAVIILDLQMPGMDGLQTAKFIRENPYSQHIPIIFISTFHSEEDVIAVYEMGAVDYLLKPIVPQILKAKVSVFVDLYKKNQELQLKQQQQAEASITQSRLAFLSEASNILSSSLDYQATLTAVAHLVVPYLADWCLIDIVGENGEINRLAVAHKDPEKESWLRELQQKYPINADSDHGVSQVLRTGQALIAPKILDSQLVRVARNEEHLQILRELGIKSSMVVPLGNRDQRTGTITFVLVDINRRYGADDLIVAEDLAFRASLAIENAHLYHKAQIAIEMHRTIEEQLMLLTEAANFLLSSIKLNELLPAILTLSRRLIAADAYAVWRYRPDKKLWQIVSAAGLSEQYQRAAFEVMTPGNIQEKAYIFEDVEKIDMIADRVGLYRAEGIKSLLSMPLTIQGVRTGTIAFYYRELHNFSEVEIQLATALSNIAAAAISSAEIYKAQSQS